MNIRVSYVENDVVFIEEELGEMKTTKTPKNLMANPPWTRVRSTSMN